MTCKSESGVDCSTCKCELSNFEKWKYTLYTTIIFILVSLPYTYKITNKLFKSVVGILCEKNGCPTNMGLIIHTIVFTLILRYIM